MDPIFEKNLISTKEASELSGYTSDYLARLARSEKISARRVGHTWLIDSESLKSFLDQQGDRKIDYARALARAREKEYRARHAPLQQITSTLTKPIQMPEKLDSVVHALRSHALAVSLSLAVVVSGALVANVAAISPLTNQAAIIAHDVAYGFDETFGDIPSRVALRIAAMRNVMSAISPRVASHTVFTSAYSAPPFADINLSSLQMKIDDTYRASRVTFFSNPTFAPITRDTIRSAARDAYALITHPSRIADSFMYAYVAIGADTYAALSASLSGYRSLIEESGIQSLALASAARDALRATPNLVARMNLAFGAAIIGASHAAIRADTAVAYGLAEAAPRSARATVAFLGETGDLLAKSASRAPALATALFLRVTRAPAHIAPALASAVFNAEYAVSARFVKDTHALFKGYLGALTATGRLVYEGTSGTIALAHTATSLIAKTPGAIEDAYLAALGRGALALDSFARVSQTAAALHTLSTGERIAFAIYETVRNFFDATRRALAFLFGSPPKIAISPPEIIATTSATSAAPARVVAVNNYPTYTTVVRGVSEDFMNQSLASLRTNVLATVADMIQPVSRQVVNNSTTIQQVNMIQDLSNLIVRNGDFRGSIFDSGIRVTATDGNFTNLTGGTTSLGATTITGALTTTGALSSNTSATAPYFTATSTTATSTFAGSLSVGTTTPFGNGLLTIGTSTPLLYVSNTTGRIGIGTTTPGSLLSIGNTGGINFTLATSSFSTTGGINLTSGCFAVNGVCAGTGSGVVGSGTTGQLAFYNAAGTNLTATSSIFLSQAGNVGIGTSSPTYALSVEGSSSLGNQAIAGYFTATSSAASTFPYASTTALTVSGTSGLQLAAALNGPLQANAGLVSATTSVLAQYGGTGQTSYTIGDFLYASATNLLSRLGIGTGGFVLGSVNGVPSWVATTTFSSGLSYSAGNVTNTGVLSLGPTGSALTGALVIATSSTAFNGLTASTTVTGSGTTLTFANTLAGLLNVGGGGTGQTSFGQGWLHSDGTALTSSTSPTVNYITATSTTATSAFAGGLTVGGSLTVNGLCVTGDTRLRRRRKAREGEKDETDEDGYIYDEVAIVDIKSGDEIQSLNEKTGKLVWSRVKQLAYMGKKQTFKLRTASGKTIRTTANHPYLARTTQNTPLRVGVFIDSSNLYHAAKKAEWQIGLRNLKELLLQSFDIVSACCYIAMPREGDPAREGMQAYVKAAARFFSVNKKLLKYIFDTETRKNIKKGDVDLDIAMDVVRALPNLDAVVIMSGDSDYLPLAKYTSEHGVPTVFMSYKESMAWELRLGNHLFIEHIRQSIDRATINPDLSAGAALTKSIIQKAIMESSVHKTAVDNPPSPKATEGAAPVRPGEGSWLKVSELKEGMEIVVAASKSVVAWDRIISLEPVAEEDVYDIEVEGTHNFIGNGIVAHNTAIFQQASTTLFSSLGPAYFGSTATSSFSTTGTLTLASALGIASGGTASSTPLGGILVGNGSSAIKSLSIGTNLTFDGTTLNATGGGGSGTVSTSTNEISGYLPRWTSTSGTPALLGNSAVFQSGSNIAIGTTSPYATLSIWGDSSTAGNAFQVVNSASTTLLSIPNLSTGTSTFSTALQALVLNITSTTATSTFANGINLTNGCFAIGGTCVGGGGAYTVQVFTSSGTWTKPAGVTKVRVRVVGGGGGGGGWNGFASYYGGGGGGGGFAEELIDVSSISSETVTVGTGGAGGTSNGSSGGTSSFGAHASATGGVYGSGSNGTTGAGGAAGAGSGGNLNITGTPGTNGTTVAGIGGSSFYHKNYGGGGDGATGAGVDGGAGSGGVVIVEEYTTGSVTAGSVGSGTVGQLSYYAQNGSALTATSSIFLATSGNVGIGTTTPNWLFQVAGTRPSLALSDTSAGANLKHWLFSSMGGNLYIGTSTDAYATSTPAAFTISNAGNVGIGTTGPTNILHVVGNGILAVNTVTTGLSNLATFRNSAASAVGVIIQSDQTNGYGIVAAGTSASRGLKFQYTDASADKQEGITLTNAGKVGIGTTNPNEGKVEVKGGTVCVDTDSNDSATSCIANESDSRLKSNIQAISASSSLAAILALRPVSFDWRATDSEVLSHWPALGRYAATPHSIGLIAQEVVPILPEAIGTETVGDAEVQYYQLDYTKFIPPLIGAVQALEARTNFISNAATSTVLTVDVAGNVGIGTSTPNHMLTVAGEVAAIGFVNTSTKTAKTDIEYATASSTEDMLNRLKSLKIAKYHYKIENQNDPLRLGFIAEEAQSIAPEILSADGKGVDLYKLATFNLAATQALAAKFDAMDSRVTSLEARMTALESGAVSSASGSPLALSSSTLASAFEGLGVLIKKGIAQFNTLVFRQLVASKDEDGTSSAGSVSILAGNTVAQVNNSIVIPSTKIFVTFNSQITGSWWVSDKAVGSFRVVLSVPQAADVSFDYFLVQTEGALATSTPPANVDFVSPQSGGTDTTPPVITLLGDNPMHLSVGGTFVEPGITASDDVDGAISVYVAYVNGIEQPDVASAIDTSIQTTYIITYSAADARGNGATATRSVIVGSDVAPTSSTASSTPVSTDATAPVVTLIGAAAMEMTVGDIFTDPGATATDDTDGDLTASTVVTGLVDPATAGLYTLTYTATDTALNSASASRVVTVLAAP